MQIRFIWIEMLSGVDTTSVIQLMFMLDCLSGGYVNRHSAMWIGIVQRCSFQTLEGNSTIGNDAAFFNVITSTFLCYDQSRPLCINSGAVGMMMLELCHNQFWSLIEQEAQWACIAHLVFRTLLIKF